MASNDAHRRHGGGDRVDLTPESAPLEVLYPGGFDPGSTRIHPPYIRESRGYIVAWDHAHAMDLGKVGAEGFTQLVESVRL